ncbi:MAG: hypothetical protein QHH19_01015 [Candidatus Thermoplasmatota archaeon]|jgi:hypothetical protein|nr:hypothetical protein [Candidatus Thermoplasmatota archaeon]
MTASALEIDDIGKRLVGCKYHCEGVTNKPREGILPRCLIFEHRKGKNGSVVVGLNPGKAKKREQEFYLDHNNTYESVKKYWDDKVKNLKYYSNLRELISMLGFDGPIVWTDLAKCQSSHKNGVVPIQTMRTCIDTYLRREIELFPSYTIFGVGNIAFEFCALSFPEHFVVGIPHPTGSYGNFSRLIKNINRNKKEYLKKISDKKDKNKRYKALKIFQ